jgi:hypothetical protein
MNSKTKDTNPEFITLEEAASRTKELE